MLHGINAYLEALPTAPTARCTTAGVHRLQALHTRIARIWTIYMIVSTSDRSRCNEYSLLDQCPSWSHYHNSRISDPHPNHLKHLTYLVALPRPLPTATTTASRTRRPIAHIDRAQPTATLLPRLLISPFEEPAVIGLAVRALVEDPALVGAVLGDGELAGRDAAVAGAVVRVLERDGREHVNPPYSRGCQLTTAATGLFAGMLDAGSSSAHSKKPHSSVAHV